VNPRNSEAIEIKDMVLSYLFAKRNALLKGSKRGEAVIMHTSPFMVARWGEAEGMFNPKQKNVPPPVLYKILKYLDFLMGEPWLCSAVDIRITTDGPSSKFTQYEFEFVENGQTEGGDDDITETSKHSMRDAISDTLSQPTS
tara:strand:- start:3284 stop:3709 length:426 start_codon:yes stop_codon:yes gene_type:complete